MAPASVSRETVLGGTLTLWSVPVSIDDHTGRLLLFARSSFLAIVGAAHQLQDLVMAKPELRPEGRYPKISTGVPVPFAPQGG